jgi:fructose-bisphosphate aldolase class I
VAPSWRGLHRRARPERRVDAQGAQGLRRATFIEEGWRGSIEDGIEEGAWSSDEEMFGLIHQMRSRIITSPCFGGGKVIGAILFERTMDGEIDGKPVPQALIDAGVVPFIKIDKGLEDEADGVQLMKPMPELDALLERAKALGVFGTKERSVINLANREGSPQSSRSSSRSRAGARPRPGADHRARGEHQEPERAEADRILLEELLKGLDACRATTR